MRFKNKTTAQEIVDQIQPLIEASLGDLSRSVDSFSSMDDATASSFIFAIHPKMLEKVLQSEAQCLLLPLKAKESIEKMNLDKTFLFSRNPELAAREVKKTFVFPTPYRAPFKGIHPTAVIAESAQLAEDVIVSPYAIIGENCVIGSGSFIGSHSVIEENVKMGTNVTIHPQAYVGHSCEIGNDCEIMPQAIVGSEGYGYAHDHLGNHYRIPHTGKVVLEDDVHVGAATAIDRGTITDSVVGKGTKIDNQCHLGHNARVGKNGLITAQFVSAGSATIGDNFICGGKTAVTGHVTITDNVNLGGFSAVTNDMNKPGQYSGYPVQPLKDFLRTKTSSTHLPQMRKDIKKLLKKVFPEES